jgi:hypothetical protein
MSHRTVLLESIAKITADYRAGEPATPTPEHIDTWVNQFDRAVQEPILQELNHVFKKTYFSRKKVEEFIISLLNAKKLVGDDPCAFWKTVNFLNIQGGGKSQIEMLHIFDGLLKAQCGYGIDKCGVGSNVYLYLDDAIFTGNRVKQDLQKWINETAPQKALVYIVCIALHTGYWLPEKELKETAKQANKQIDFRWGQAIKLEDRKKYIENSDVLRPVEIPEDQLVQQYVREFTRAPILRPPGKVGENSLFSSESGRHLLEQEFLKAGAKIREKCPHLGISKRPLGHISYETLGFGSMIVTFRNCPNNAPLALWVSEPWTPLFRRKTNADTLDEQALTKIRKGKAL